MSVIKPSDNSQLQSRANSSNLVSVDLDSEERRIRDPRLSSNAEEQSQAKQSSRKKISKRS